MEAGQQQKLRAVEQSAKEIEMILKVAESGIRLLISELKVGTVAPATPQYMNSDDDINSPILAASNNDCRRTSNDSDRIVHEILDEEFKHPLLTHQ